MLSDEFKVIKNTNFTCEHNESVGVDEMTIAKYNLSRSY